MPSREHHDTLQRFHIARSDPGLAVLEGLHPLKHALRFDAEVLEMVTPDLDVLAELAPRLTGDVAAQICSRARLVPRDIFDRLAPKPPATGVLTLAKRPIVDLQALFESSDSAPIVWLDRVAHLGNLGAAVRVSAAVGAAGLITTGRHDPWNAESIRGAAGLQFALPVTRAGGLPKTDRPVVAIDPEGEALKPGALPDRSILLFGAERSGLHPDLLARATHHFRLPMRPGISSLNLATTVAAALYLGCWRNGD